MNHATSRGTAPRLATPTDLGANAAKDIAGASFEDHPYYYSMSFFWSNIKDNTTNILGKLGRWIGIAAQASHPMYPDRGMTILRKRCPNDITFPACSCTP